MLPRLSSKQIASMFKQNKQFKDSLTIYYQKAPSFAYQTLFSKKTDLNHPQRNKIKRQIREILLKENFIKLPAHLLVYNREGESNFSNLKNSLVFIKQQLITKLII